MTEKVQKLAWHDARYILARAGGDESVGLSIGVRDDPGIVDGCLHLNHKGTRSAVSVTGYICDQPDGIIATWQAHFRRLQEAEAQITILMEDASPDSILAVIALDHRLRGEAFPETWRVFADRWENGFVTDAAEPEFSFGALVSAFAHARFQVTSDRLAMRENALQPIAKKLLTLASALIAESASPNDISGTLRLNAPGAQRVLSDARASLAYERQVYRTAEKSARKVQLGVHLRGEHRKTLVDAILFSETELTGALKCFCRSDRSSPTGAGYAVMGVHRPSPDLKGTGNDIVISTDPQKGLSLKALWLSLEQAEDTAWSASAHGPRPRGDVDGRRDRVLEGNSLPGGPTPCHQPWWHGGESFEMIAAPRKVCIDGIWVPGSLLDWQKVKALIWECYAPTLGLRLRTSGSGCDGAKFTDPDASDSLRETLNINTDLHLVMAERCFDAMTDILLWSPTLSAALADFVTTGRTSIDGLPETLDFDLIEERGGLAITCEGGTVLIDLRNGTEFPMSELRRVAGEVARTVALAEEIVERIRSKIRPAAMKALDGGRDRDKREALKGIYEARLHARREIEAARRFEQDGLLRRFRSHCETRWSGKERLEGALNEISELEEMVLGYSEVRANMILNALAVFGLPLSLAGNFLGGLVIMSGAEFDGIALPILAAFGISLIGATLALLILFAASGRRWILRGDRSQP